VVPCRPQVVSPEFLFILLFLCIHLMRLDFLIGTVVPQVMEDFTDSSTTNPPHNSITLYVHGL
jgi:hypothetical protein